MASSEKKVSCIHIRNRKYPGSKWHKHVALMKNDSLQKHLPKTNRYTSQTLVQYLKKFNTVFLKPNLGGGGKGIIKICKNAEQKTFSIRSLKSKRDGLSLSSTMSILQRHLYGKKYLIQQGIDLLSSAGRPIDFRVLFLKTEMQWKLMGVWASLQCMISS